MSFWGSRFRYLAERPGSGDGERKTWLTRQIAFEPPACIRFVRLGVGDGSSYRLRLCCPVARRWLNEVVLLVPAVRKLSGSMLCLIS